MICVIGAHKTGTTSVVDIIEKALDVQWDDHAMKEYTFSPEAAILWGNDTDQPILRDSPFNFCDLYKTLDRLFPKAKFVLTLREGNSWYDSVQRWISLHPHLLPIYDYLYKISSRTKEEIIEIYHQRNTEIVNYFKTRPSKLAVIDLWKDSDTSSLTEFLGVPSVKLPKNYPHLRRTE